VTTSRKEDEAMSESTLDIALTDASLIAQTERHAALVNLNEAAEVVDDSVRAQEIMVKGRLLALYLKEAKAPFEEARLAGKASVVAGRRLGRMLSELSNQRRWTGQRFEKSDRGQVLEELGISKRSATDIVRLSHLDDADFQRYIQLLDRVPSVNGALIVCGMGRSKGPRTDNYRVRRRRAAGVKQPPNPSLDEAYSLIVRALGHLDGKRRGRSPRQTTAIGLAIDHLYDAEDALRPHLGNYTSP
jgi:hypothetical protein